MAEQRRSTPETDQQQNRPIDRQSDRAGNEKVVNRERSMDDPTRGRQGDTLEEELPHGNRTDTRK